MDHCENCGKKLNFRNRVPGLNRCVDCQKEYVQALRAQAKGKPSGSLPMPLGTLPEAPPVQQHKSHVWRWIIGVPVALFLVLIIIGALAAPSTTSSSGSTSSQSSQSSSSSSNAVSVPAQAPSNTHQIRYVVTGHAYITYQNDQGGIEQNADVQGFDHSYSMQRGDHAGINAQNLDDSGSVTCTIYLDGQQWKHSQSSGPGTLTSCSGVVGY